MRGFPRHLATKRDYMNCLELYPEETKRALRALYADRWVWEAAGELTDGEEGVNDATHRTERNPETGTVTQYELKEDMNARVFRLGFTAYEIEQLTA